MKLLKDGIMFSFGVFLSHLLSYFSSGRAETTAILSVMTFTTCGSGPLAAIAIKTLGYRKGLWESNRQSVKQKLRTFSFDDVAIRDLFIS